MTMQQYLLPLSRCEAQSLIRL